MSVALMDPRPRMRRVAAPVAGAALLGACALYIAAVDPNQAGHYPLCPMKWATGLDCPGCGGLRATHSLMHGDLLGAMDHNLLAVLLLPLVVVWWVSTVRRRWSGEAKTVTESSVKRTRFLWITFGVVAVVFTIVRNLPFVPFLGSV